ncbi:Transcription factor SOX-4 [Branchiostoma belcheri]|nr:Transcription factor SOX-4 [Branchiostoma belcheri]
MARGGNDNVPDLPVDEQTLGNVFREICGHRYRETFGRLMSADCYGCKVDHPSQRHHPCLFLHDDELREYGHRSLANMLFRKVYADFVGLTVYLCEQEQVPPLESMRQKYEEWRQDMQRSTDEDQEEEMDREYRVLAFPAFLTGYVEGRRCARRQTSAYNMSSSPLRFGTCSALMATIMQSWKLSSPLVKRQLGQTKRQKPPYVHKQGQLEDVYQHSKNNPMMSASAGTHIKRPMNAFLIWSTPERRYINKLIPELKNSDVSKYLGRRWGTLTEEQKRPFFERARNLKQVHMAKYPHYRYQPREVLRQLHQNQLSRRQLQQNQWHQVQRRRQPHPLYVTWHHVQRSSSYSDSDDSGAEMEVDSAVPEETLDVEVDVEAEVQAEVDVEVEAGVECELIIVYYFWDNASVDQETARSKKRPAVLVVKQTQEKDVQVYVVIHGKPLTRTTSLVEGFVSLMQ